MTVNAMKNTDNEDLSICVASEFKGYLQPLAHMVFSFQLFSRRALSYKLS